MKHPMIKNEIDPRKEYSLLEIVKLGVLGKSHATVSAAIWRDKNDKDILKTRIIGSGKASRYEVLGSNLLLFMKKQHG